MSRPYLEWTDENQEKCSLEVVDKVFIGRACVGIEETKCIIVKHGRASRDHAVITLIGSQLEVTDNSKNGTWVNGVRLMPGSSQSLADGDEIQIGVSSILVKCPDLATHGKKVINDEKTKIVSTNVTVTNLVADVRGFSSMTQIEDSSNVYALMKEVIRTFSSIVHDYNGTIKDYVGDAVYAFWDHRFVPQKKMALLACQAALRQSQSVNEIRAKISGINPAAKFLRMGWGITTGKVTMSHYGSRTIDLALVGDCTNLAFRLSGIANKDLPSEIVICSETANLVSETPELEVFDLGSVPVKGRSGEEKVFGIKQT